MRCWKQLAADVACLLRVSVSEITRRGATKKDDVQKTRRVEWSRRLVVLGRDLLVTAAKGEVRLLLQVQGQWAPQRASTAALLDNSGRKCTWLALCA